MKLLHISHHVGCMRDHAYVYDKLGFSYEFWKFPKGVFKITKDVANSTWKTKKDYFNSFDVIVTSDTAPLSRIFMENADELTPHIIVWVCNRFDYSMESDPSFYDIFSKMAVHDKFTVVPYSDFEQIWCSHKGITGLYKVITPIGVNPRHLDDKIDSLPELKAQYIDDPNSKTTYIPGALSGKIAVSIYSNDNTFFNVKDILESHNIPVFNGGYSHPEDLRESIGLVTFPDAFSKLSAFETIQNGVLVFLPSMNFMHSLVRTPGYWFNCPGRFCPPNSELLRMCEFYRYEKCRIYFDSIEDLVVKIKTLTPDIIAEKKHWCGVYGNSIEATEMAKWRSLFESRSIYTYLKMNSKITKDDVIVECGTHTGQDTKLLCSLFSENIVHSIEANVDLFTNARQIGYDNLILHNFGLSDSNGDKTFYIDTDPRGDAGASSFLPANSSGGMSHLSKIEKPIHIKCKTLDIFIADNAISSIYLLWLDIEQHEYDVLRACSPDTFKKVKYIYTEVNYQELRTGGKFCNDIVTLLSEHGFVERLRKAQGAADFSWQANILFERIN